MTWARTPVVKLAHSMDTYGGMLIGGRWTLSNRRSEIQEDLAIIGMTCAACSARVERALAREPGVVRKPT